MDAVQYNFAGGMSAMADPSKTGANQYRLGLNVRIRRNVIEGSFRPVVYSTPDVTHQALFVTDDQLVLIAGGEAFAFNDTTDQFVEIAGFSAMSADADRIYHCAVPRPTNYLMRDNGGDVVYNSNISTTPEATVLQDGLNQPRLLFSDLTSAVSRNYNEWSYTRPEYIPIGLQMAYSGNVLYIVAPNRKTIYQSVSGRPLDFMRNINSATGAKGGDASTTATAVSAAPLTAITPGQNGGFIAATFYNMYAGVLSPEYPLIFGEPYLQPLDLFPVGAVNQYSFGFAAGESVFISSAGIQSFNQTQQLRWQSNNSPFGAPINDFIVRPITTAAVVSVDDYVFFALETIFGHGVLVFDTRLGVFVSIDLVGEVKEFAVLNRDGINRLFYITTSNRVCELPLYEGVRSPFGVYLGEITAGTPKMELEPQRFEIGLTDVLTSGEITLQLYTDKQLTQTISTAVTAEVSGDTDNLLLTTPVAFPLEGQRKNETIPLAFHNARQGYAIGFFITCTADCRLASVSADIASRENASTKLPAVTTTDQLFTFVGNIIPEFVDFSADEIAVTTGEQYVFFANVGYGQQTLKNANATVTANDGKSRVFKALAGYVYPSSDDSRVLQYTSLSQSLAQVNKTTTRGIFLLPNLGDTANANPVYTLASGISDNIPVYLVVRPNTLQVPVALGLCGLPAYKCVQTDYVNFYVIQLTDTITDETRETGPIGRWLAIQLANDTSGRFNVVVLGTPPYSNCTGDIVENTDLRWSFARLGVHLVISTAGCYERFNYDNVTYINIGTGNTTELETVAGGIAAAGRFELAARASILGGSFIDLSGAIRDSVSILK